MALIDEGWEEVPPPIHTKPAIQIVSMKIIASIHKDKNTIKEPLELYGEIYVTDDKGKDYYIYERNENDPESVSLGGFVTLTSPACVIPACYGVCISFELNARNYNDFEFYMDCRLLVDIEDDHERLLRLKLKGEGYDVVLEYFVLQCGVTGVVDVIVKNNSLSSKFLNGKVLAFYDDICERKNYPQIVLHNSLQQHVEPGSKSRLQLDYKHVAFNSYSSLIIKVELNGSEKSFTFKPKDQFYGINRYFFGDIALKVKVNWISTFDYNINTRQRPLDQDCYIFCDTDDDVEEEEESNVAWCPMDVRNYADIMTEVFSVYIGRKSNQVVALYGTIEVRTDEYQCYLFNRDEDTAEVLSASEKMLRINGPSEPFLQVPFYLVVDLKDKLSPLAIKGDEYWNEFIFDAHKSILLNRRSLAVFRGNCGYAAVHYMMNAYAIDASITFTAEAAGEDITDVTRHVRGSIYARYGIHYYETKYDRDFYRSVLFKEDCARELTVKEGKYEIPLRTSLVCVDYRSSLVLDIDVVGIKIEKENQKKTNEFVFKQSVEFKPPRTSKCQGKSLEIGVTWNYPRCVLRQCQFPWMKSNNVQRIG